jgi:hypothetical protein
LLRKKQRLRLRPNGLQSLRESVWRKKLLLRQKENAKNKRRPRLKRLSGLD